MFCGKCGNEIKEGERFCSNCGKSINHIEKEKNSNNFNKKIIFVVLVIIVIVAIIGTVIFISNRKNSNVKNSDVNQITNNIQQSDRIKENTKYIATGIEDLYKQGGLTELYLVFNNDEFKLVLNINMGKDKYEGYIRGNYNQTENHIIFDFSNAKVGYNNGKLDETGDIIDQFAELFKDGATISNENKTLKIVEEDGITFAFEDSGIQIAKEENTTEGAIFEIDMNDKGQQEQKQERNSKDLIKATIDAYAKITTHHDGYDLQYMGYTQYARSINGKNVYIITYLAKVKDYGTPTGLNYCRLVSLNSTNTMIDKKSDFCQWASAAGSVESSPLLRHLYEQIWGN